MNWTTQIKAKKDEKKEKKLHSIEKPEWQCTFTFTDNIKKKNKDARFLHLFLNKKGGKHQKYLYTIYFMHTEL